ncbi:MAG: thioredoxin family protein [Oscillospiraceae bacterium]|nr:thioredoxin family protein [Oscillospiraceae bacterium]
MKRSVIECRAAWSDASRRMAPRMAELAAEYAAKAAFLCLDADAAPELMAEYRVRALPTLLFLEDGAEVARLVGERRKEELRALLD